jgi:hypothetical protein
MKVKTINKIWIGIILFYAILFAGLALYDEEPSKEMLEVLNRPLPEVIEPGNAWMVMLGFNASPGIDPYKAGEQKMLELKAMIDSGKDIREIILANINERKDGLKFKGDTYPYYDSKNGGVLKYAGSHKKEIRQLEQDNRELLNRYEALLKCPRFAEPVDYGHYAPLHLFGPVRDALMLKHIILAERAANGQYSPVLEELKQDMEFWRFITRNSELLITNLTAHMGLNISIRFAADLGANISLSDREQKILFEALSPFDKSETSMKKAFLGEFRYMHRSMDLANVSGQRIMERIFVKRNATENGIFQYYFQAGKLSELTAEQYADEAGRKTMLGAGREKSGLRFLYNPAGAILILIGRGHLTYYIEKGHNLEGLRRLAILKILIRQEKVHQADIQKFIDSRKSDLGNPYTGEPMKWDPKGRILYFDNLSQNGRIELFL